MSDNPALDEAMKMMARHNTNKTEKHYFDLQESEKTLVQTAGRIYGSYVEAGLVTPENKDEYINTAIQDAIRIASRIEDIVNDAEEQIH